MPRIQITNQYTNNQIDIIMLQILEIKKAYQKDRL